MRTTPQRQPIAANAALPSSNLLASLAERLALLALIGLCAAALLLLRPLPARWVAQLDDPAMVTNLRLRGFYGWERNADFAYRWSSSAAEIALPLRYQTPRSYLAEFRIRRAEQSTLQMATWSVNDRPFATSQADLNFRTYQMLLPIGAEGDAYLRVGLATTRLAQAGSSRDLGLILSQVSIRPLAHPKPWPALVVTLGLLAIWPILRRGASASVALLVLAEISAMLVVLFWFMIPTALSYPWLAGITLASCAVAALIARTPWARLGLAVILILAGFASMLWGAWFTDDAFISFRYAANLAHGNGLVFNPGERVEGFTNFLWTLLAAACIWVGGDVLFWSYAAGVAIGLAIILLCYSYAARLLGPVWGLLAALLAGTSQSLLLYTTRGAGMETGFFTLLVLAASGMLLNALYSQDPALRLPLRSLIMIGLLFALATLTRPEGVLFMALTVGYLLWDQLGELPMRNQIRARIRELTRQLAPLVLAYLVIVVPFFIWRLSYYGDLLPNTFYAKTGGGLRAAGRGFAYIGESVLLFGVPLAALGVAGLLLPAKGARGWVSYLALLLVPYLLYIVAVGGDHFPGERFFVPIIPWLALLCAAGCARIYQFFPRVAWRWSVAMVLAGLLAWHAAIALDRGLLYEERVAGSDESVWLWRDLGVWLREETPPDTSIAAMGIGAIAFYSERSTIDMLGLTDRHIARVAVIDESVGPAGHEKRDPDYVLNVRRPTYIPQIWEDYFGGQAVLSEQYQLTTIRTHQGQVWGMWKRVTP